MKKGSRWFWLVVSVVTELLIDYIPIAKSLHAAVKHFECAAAEYEASNALKK